MRFAQSFMLNGSIHKAWQKAALILEYEPSWFAEFMVSTALFWWSAFALISDDFPMTWKSYVMPLFGLVFGPFRVFLFLQRDPMPRVLAACLSFVFFSILLSGSFHRNGFVPMMGLCIAMMVGDFLTVGKFSLWARRLMKASISETA